MTIADNASKDLTLQASGNLNDALNCNATASAEMVKFAEADDAEVQMFNVRAELIWMKIGVPISEFVIASERNFVI